MRAVAALLVVGTHAAFATGKLTHGYVGAIYARLEIGVAIFFVLSGFLLFRPWVRAVADGSPAPSLSRYGRHRVRRILPGYVVTVVVIFAIYTVFTPGPNPGQTWYGLFRYLTFTQIYTDELPDDLAASGAVADVEPGGRGVLLRRPSGVRLCGAAGAVSAVGGGRVAPCAGLAVLAAVTPHGSWSSPPPPSPCCRTRRECGCPRTSRGSQAAWRSPCCEAAGARCAARIAIPLAVGLYLVVSSPVGGSMLGPDPTWVPMAKSALYAAIATLAVAPLALGVGGWYEQVLSSRPMVWLGEISYEIFLLHVGGRWP